jgi:hypothetical protein
LKKVEIHLKEKYDFKKIGWVMTTEIIAGRENGVAENA